MSIPQIHLPNCSLRLFNFLLLHSFVDICLALNKPKKELPPSPNNTQITPHARGIQRLTKYPRRDFGQFLYRRCHGDINTEIIFFLCVCAFLLVIKRNNKHTREREGIPTPTQTHTTAIHIYREIRYIQEIRKKERDIRERVREKQTHREDKCDLCLSKCNFWNICNLIALPYSIFFISFQ